MPIVSRIYLRDPNSVTWKVAITNQGIAQTIQEPGFAVNSVLLQDVAVPGQYWKLSVNIAGKFVVTSTTSTTTQTQLLANAPDGILYGLQISNGILQSAFGFIPAVNCSSLISTLAAQVDNRLEETDPPVFWNQQFEIYGGLEEAINDLMLMIGRPTQSVNIPITLMPNSVWQQMPPGILLITDLVGPSAKLRKVDLHVMDYLQSSWNSEWENDRAIYPIRWFPLGFTMFGVHPAPETSIQVTMTGIAYATSDPYPYTGNEVVPFHDEFFQALEKYTACYARLKEMGAEFKEGAKLYEDYLAEAQRLNKIENRRDPLIFSHAFGGQTGTNHITER